MERVLTDGEVEACWRAWKHQHHVELIRGAEAAVLDRMTKLGYRMHIPIAPAYGFVTEAEARERERTAFLRGADGLVVAVESSGGSVVLDSMERRALQRELDNRYPKAV